MLNLLLFLTSKNVIQGELCVSHNKSHDSLVDYIYTNQPQIVLWMKAADLGGDDVE